MPVKSTPQDVFQRIRITPSCWWWEGRLNDKGYGVVDYENKTKLAHRLVYSFYGGDLSSPLLRHKCDNKRCVNPDHLLPGTAKQNAEDAVERGLYRRGEVHQRAVITLKECHQIRDLLECGLFFQREIAEMYEVKLSLIADIKYNRTWKGL